MTVKTQDAQAAFSRADHLYRTKQYRECIAILDELNHAFPNQRHILYPSARCLAKLGRMEQAESLCDRLVDEFGYTKALELKLRIQRVEPEPQPLEGEFAFDALSIDHNATTIPMGPRPKPAPNPMANWIVAAIFVLMILAGLVAVYFTLVRTE